MWTQDNTEGFSDTDLSIINAALEAIMADAGDDVDPANINDALNNAWVDGMTAPALEAAARKRLGL